MANVMKVWLLVAVVGCGLCANTAEARFRIFRRSSSSSSSAGVGSHLAVAIDVNCQAVAQERANAMARRGILSHTIHDICGCVGWSGHGARGEGIGCGYGDPKSIATCIVGSTVVADAHAVSGSGQVYRVRLFR